jgi:hypothetical protein
MTVFPVLKKLLLPYVLKGDREQFADVLVREAIVQDHSFAAIGYQLKLAQVTQLVADR